MGANVSKSKSKTKSKSKSSSANSSTTKRNNTRKNSKNTNQTSPTFEHLYFNERLAIWPAIQEKLEKQNRSVVFFAEDERSKITDDTLVSRPVLRWFDSHWNTIMSFCNEELDTRRARLRFRNIELPETDENEFELPLTPSPHFSPFVTYQRNLALCIRHDGLIEGFMLLEKGWRKNVELDVICTGPKKKGIGRILIQALKEWCVKGDIRSITLTAVPSAIDFYKKLGFTTVKQVHARDDADMLWNSESK